MLSPSSKKIFEEEHLCRELILVLLFLLELKG